MGSLLTGSLNHSKHRQKHKDPRSAIFAATKRRVCKRCLVCWDLKAAPKLYSSLLPGFKDKARNLKNLEPGFWVDLGFSVKVRHPFLMAEAESASSSLQALLVLRRSVSACCMGLFNISVEAPLE